MPKRTSSADSRLPSTLERSPKKAQDTFEKTLASAEETYDGDESRAHRAAFASLKHSFEKVGDHWEPKEHRGPSDERAAQGGPNPSGRSHHGVDVAGKSKSDLLDEAHRLGAKVTSHMNKDEVAQAIEHANDAATRRARER